MKLEASYNLLDTANDWSSPAVDRLLPEPIAQSLPASCEASLLLIGVNAVVENPELERTGTKHGHRQRLFKRPSV